MNLFGELAKSTINRALGNSGPQLSFNIGEKTSSQPENSIWTLHHGTIKTDKQDISVFIFEFKRNPNMISLARNAFKRIKTIRYPGIPKFIDGAETETSIIIGTQKIEPLSYHLSNTSDKLIRLGLYTIAATLKFLTLECKLIHANVNENSIFVTKSGEWMYISLMFRLGGIEFMGPADAVSFKNYSDMLRHQILPPEFNNYLTSDALMRYPTHSFDAWLFGIFVHLAFKNIPVTVDTLNKRGNIPIELFKYVRGLTAINPESRISFEQFLAGTSLPGGYFDDKLIESRNFLDNFAIQDKEAKEAFLL